MTKLTNNKLPLLAETRIKMNLDSLNKWLTLTANIGVLIGLVFLGIEVRHAGNATELQTIESTTEGWFRLNELIISDPEVARIWVLGLHDPEALTDTETIQFSMYFRMFGNQVLRVKDQYELGLATQENFELASKQLATFSNTAGGQLYVKTSPTWEQNFGEIVAPYIDSEPIVELMMGRDIEGLR